MSSIIIRLILFYQKYSPKFIRKCCRYSPCCSDYSILAINKYGIGKGIFLTFRRIIRCIPPLGGIDVP